MFQLTYGHIHAEISVSKKKKKCVGSISYYVLKCTAWRLPHVGWNMWLVNICRYLTNYN